MEKVFILFVYAYDDLGEALGSHIEGVYTTLEIAQKKMAELKQAEDSGIDYSFNIIESVVEGE
jgi:hypothetical protein